MNAMQLGHRHAVAGRLATAALLVVFGLVAGAGAAGAAESKGGSGIMVNINTASAEELQALPGVGERRAEQIVSLRKERGSFKQIAELLEVRGIGPAMLERMRPQVTLSGKTRLAPSGGPSSGKAGKP